MKVVLKIPIPGAKDMVMEADGSPEEVAQFLQLWLKAFEKVEVPKEMVR